MIVCINDCAVGRAIQWNNNGEEESEPCLGEVTSVIVFRNDDDEIEAQLGFCKPHFEYMVLEAGDRMSYLGTERR